MLCPSSLNDVDSTIDETYRIYAGRFISVKAGVEAVLQPQIHTGLFASIELQLDISLSLSVKFAKLSNELN